MKRIALLLPLLIIAGCATVSPEAKVRAKLEGAGLSPALSACMAHRMVEKLSLEQLRELGRLGKLGGGDVRGMSIDEILGRLRGIEDPKVVKVVSKAALVCSIDPGIR